METANFSGKDMAMYAIKPWKLFGLALPLILTELSTSSMLVIDRLILANYSFSSMNAVTNAAASIGVLQYSFLTLATIATVFAGRQNGANNFQQVARAPWQMVWFSLYSILIFTFLAQYTGKLFVNPNYHSEGLPYFKLIMHFGFLTSLVGAIASFFIGIGRVKIITTTAIITNIINLLLDIILVFGIDDIIPAMGTKGAAIATVSAQLIHLLILGVVFLSKYNRDKYATKNYTLDMPLFKECLRIGLPSSMSYLIAFSAWAFLLYCIAGLGDDYMLIFSISHTLFLLYKFALDGLFKVISTVASNLIGSLQLTKMKSLILSASRIHFGFSVLFALPACLFPDVFISLFNFSNHTLIEPDLRQSIHLTLYFVWLYFVIDGMTWILASILQAFKDTLIPMFLNGITTWFIAAVPIFIFVIERKGAPELLWVFPCCYTAILAIMYGARTNQQIKQYA